jgi:hypothetical protein
MHLGGDSSKQNLFLASVMCSSFGPNQHARSRNSRVNAYKKRLQDLIRMLEMAGSQHYDEEAQVSVLRAIECTILTIGGADIQPGVVVFLNKFWTAVASHKCLRTLMGGSIALDNCARLNRLAQVVLDMEATKMKYAEVVPMWLRDMLLYCSLGLQLCGSCVCYMSLLWWCLFRFYASV